MCLGIKATTGEVIVGNRNGVWLTRTVRRKTARERWDRSNLEMVVAVPWRKNEDTAKMDGGRLKGEVAMMDKDCSWRWRNMVQWLKRMYITREDLDVFRFTAICPGCVSLLKVTAGKRTQKTAGRRIEEELRGIVKAESSTKARE